MVGISNFLVVVYHDQKVLTRAGTDVDAAIPHTAGSIMKKWTNIAASITRVLDVGLKKTKIQYTQDNLLGVLG
jgi:hypothetical protein